MNPFLPVFGFRHNERETDCTQRVEQHLKRRIAGLAEGPVEDRAADAARHGNLAHAAATEELADARSGIGGGSIVEGLADVVHLNLVILEGLGHEDRLVRIHSDHQFLSVYFRVEIRPSAAAP